MDLIRFTEKVDLSNYTIILPSVSVGNVGQLTVDLIVTTYKFRNIGVLWHPAIIPTVGSDPYYSNNEICTACELYVNETLKIAAIQIRSGLEFSLANTFFKCLKNCLLDLNVKNVVILTSSFAYEMHTIGSGMFRYITNEDVQKQFENLKISCMEPDVNGRYIIHGSGFGSKLYEILSEGLKCTLIVKYTSEGDNRPDAVNLLDVLIKIIKFNTDKLENVVFPSSWNFVFGNPPPIDLY